MPRVPPVTTAALAIRPSLRVWPRRSIALEAHRNPHAAADAQRRQPLLCVAPLHLVEEGDEDPRPGGADRVAEGDGAAVDVDLPDIPAKVVVDRAGLGGKGLVGLDEIEIAGAPAGFFERHAAGRDRSR